MSTSFPLPLECLQLIIRHLASDADGTSLANLLCVNSYVWSATLPIMYENPFQLRPFLPGSNIKNEAILASLLKLIQVLLFSIPDGQFTRRLRAAYLPVQVWPWNQVATAAAVNQASIPYYSFVTNINFESHAKWDGGIFDNATLTSRLCYDELAQPERDGYLAEEVYGQLDFDSLEEIIACAAARDLRKDLTFALCADAEHIRILAIPISDISRYLLLAHRFKVLSGVTFLLDRDIACTLKRGEVLTPEEETVLERHREERILFIHEHRRLHPNVLYRAHCTCAETTIEDCPKEYRLRLLEPLPPLRFPRSLDSSNWAQFVTKAQDTDLSLVKAISTMKEARTEIPDRFLEQGTFLSCCRPLESPNIGFWNDHIFQWAVDERRIYMADVAQGCVPEQRLVPLRHVNISYAQLRPTLGRQINDIYSHSARLSRGLAFMASEHGFSIGEDEPYWDLPQLSEINVFMREIFLRIHPALLSRCPWLTRVYLEDEREEYRLNEIVYWTPADLSRLEYLNLVGTPALSFHPDTLNSTPILNHLELGMYQFESHTSYIPPAKELDDDEDSIGISGVGNNDSNDAGSDAASLAIKSVQRKRPTWTWDWELPKLTLLSLGAEFAYRFKFRMLAGTPNLQHFALDITCQWPGEHKRIIGIEDLIKPGFQHSVLGNFVEKERQRRKGQQSFGIRHSDNTTRNNDPEDDGKVWLDFEYVRVPMLTSMTLSGRWLIEDRVLEVLFGKVAPSIQQLVMPSSVGFSLADWVDSTSRNLLGLVRAYNTRHGAPQVFFDAGLKVASDSPIYFRHYSVTRPIEGRIHSKPALYEF
ncbi:hypothetical protein BGX29_009467 [Mortierella sp. GBA35]|nr:hypothetical protein BGX29_009467 [Mortierella sp. GBA35]